MSDICGLDSNSIKTVKGILATTPRIPLEATFELTVRCNLKCRMCLFRHDDSENKILCGHEMTAEQWIDMAKQVSEAGTLKILITGGEAMLRPDFCEIWEGIYKQGFILQLYTNATLVSPKVMDTLRKYPPHQIGITVYGASAETYQKVCGNGNAFERMKQGVKDLMTLPSQITFRSTIIKDNLCDLNAIQTLVKSEFGDYMVTNSRIVTQSVRGACADVNECRLSPEENLRVLYSRGIQKMKERVGDGFDITKVTFSKVKDDVMKNSELKNRVTLLGCEAGMTQFTITWDGKLQGCQVLGQFFTDALNTGFTNAWESFPYQIQIGPLDKRCQNCSLADECESCPATRYGESGDIQGFSEYICSFTKLHHGMFNKEKE